MRKSFVAEISFAFQADDSDASRELLDRISTAIEAIVCDTSEIDLEYDDEDHDCRIGRTTILISSMSNEDFEAELKDDPSR